MEKLPFVQVLSGRADRQLEMLAGVPHSVAHSADGLGGSAREAEAILYWAGSRELLRAAFVAAPNVRWVHSRSAGLDNMLFPELVESKDWKGFRFVHLLPARRPRTSSLDSKRYDSPK